MTLRTAVRNNGLSIAMFGIFGLTLVGMSMAGWRHENNERQTHGQSEQAYVSYVASGDFVEAVFENWESEFLQMWALVVLTVYLRQKGSIDSKPLRGELPQDAHSRLSIINTRSWQQRIKAVKHTAYAHSLGLALLSIFIISFILHAVGGVNTYNETALVHGNSTLTVFEYIASSQFWFESLQNWQSEFLAVGSLLMLSIVLRERGSQQSKPVGKRYNATTGE